MPSCFPCLPFSRAKAKEVASKPSAGCDDGDEKRQRPLSEFFSEQELQVLGSLSTRVKVMIDSSLPSTLHGTSRVTNGVPLAVVNPRAPDRRYVMLHELMHHQLDELGCPSLCCTLQGKEPRDSWLRHTPFQSFVRGLLVQLWELIQHSRFNMMLFRKFKCGPESAREKEYRSYMKNNALPAYGMCRGDGHPSLKKVAVAAHIATVMLEGSKQLLEDFRKFILVNYPNGEDMIKLGESLVRCVHSKDLEFLRMSRQELDAEMQGMLSDLERLVDSLNSGMRIKVGPILPLKEKFNGRCSTVAHVDFLDKVATPIVSVTAGGFGARFGQDLDSADTIGSQCAAGSDDITVNDANQRIMVTCSCCMDKPEITRHRKPAGRRMMAT